MNIGKAYAYNNSRKISIKTLFGPNGWSPFLAPVPLAWLTRGADWENVPPPNFPDVILLYRANPAVSMYFTKLIQEEMTEFHFFACMANALYFKDLDDPESEVYCLIKSRGGFQLLPEMETNPSVYYLPLLNVGAYDQIYSPRV